MTAATLEAAVVVVLCAGTTPVRGLTRLAVFWFASPPLFPLPPAGEGREGGGRRLENPGRALRPETEGEG